MTPWPELSLETFKEQHLDLTPGGSASHAASKDCVFLDLPSPLRLAKLVMMGSEDAQIILIGSKLLFC